MSALMNLPPLLMLLTPPTAIEYTALVPGAIVAVLSMLVILFDVFHRTETNRDYLAYVSAIGLGLTIVACWSLWDDTLSAPVFHGMLYLDKFSLFFAALCSSSAIAALLMSPTYLRSQGMDRGEYYMLILFSVCGMIFMSAAADLLTFFIALELMAMPIYVVATFLRKDRKSAEAGMKYFILGSFSSALLLYGIALIYGATGTTNFEMIGANLQTILADPNAAAASSRLVVFGMLLILSGFAFKVAAVPFHIWTPDVYTGSPTPAVGFMATAVKAASFAVLARFFIVAFYADALRGGFFGVGWIDVFAVLAGASMVLGNFAAIVQSNVKRMLAYSSIAHAGYILVGLVAANASAKHFLYNDAVLFYLLAYTFGTLGAFGVLAYLGRAGESAQTYDDLSGMGFKYPFLGLVMAVCMFSSAGIPPTAGFLGKLYVFRAAVDVGQATGEFTFIGLAILGVLTSIAGVYYYLRVLVQMYMRPEKKLSMEALDNGGAKFALIVSALLVLYLGILPGRAVDLAREAVVDLQGAPTAVQQTIAKGKAMLEKAVAPAAVVGEPAVADPPAAEPAPEPAPAAEPTPAPAQPQLDARNRAPDHPHFGHDHD